MFFGNCLRTREKSKSQYRVHTRTRHWGVSEGAKSRPVVSIYTFWCFFEIVCGPTQSLTAITVAHTRCRKAPAKRGFKSRPVVGIYNCWCCFEIVCGPTKRLIANTVARTRCRPAPAKRGLKSRPVEGIYSCWCFFKIVCGPTENPKAKAGRIREPGRVPPRVVS